MNDSWQEVGQGFSRTGLGDPDTIKSGKSYGPTLSLITNISSLQYEPQNEENRLIPYLYLYGCGVRELLPADFFDDVVWEARF